MKGVIHDRRAVALCWCLFWFGPAVPACHAVSYLTYLGGGVVCWYRSSETATNYVYPTNYPDRYKYQICLSGTPAAPLGGGIQSYPYIINGGAPWCLQDYFFYGQGGTATVYEIAENGSTVLGVITNSLVVPDNPVSAPVWLGMRSILRPGLSIFAVVMILHLVRLAVKAGQGRVD